MKKEQFKNYVLNYIEYANKVDVHVAPTKGISSGAHGRLFELLIKYAFHNCRSNGVSKAGRADTVKKINGKIAVFELKTGAGELICRDQLGDIYSDIRNNDYIVYCPDFEPLNSDKEDSDERLNDVVTDAVLQAFIMDANEFYSLAEQNNMLRKKKSRAWYGETNFSPYDHDRITLQSVNGTRLENWRALLEDNSQSLCDWLIENELNFLGL